MSRRADGPMQPQGIPQGMPLPMQPWMPGQAFHPHASNMHQMHGRTLFPSSDGRLRNNPMPKTFSYDSTSSHSSPGSMSPKHDYSSSQMSKLASTPSFEQGTRQLVAMALLEGQRRRQVADEDQQSVATERSRPLKKRKTVTPRKSSSYPAHVSPMSHMSVLSEAAATARDDHSQASTPRVVASTSTSYEEDAKEEEEEKTTTTKKTVNDDSKKPATPPPTHVVIPHFPSVLHTLLTDSPYADKVVQWLPHGKAWRIVRWEALRRQVLPQFFSPEEQSKGAGSVDAFMWHLTAWGFEEITEGPDAGAYSHEVRAVVVCIWSVSVYVSMTASHIVVLPVISFQLFRKDDAELSRQMKFNPAAPEKDDTVSAAATTTTAATQETPSTKGGDSPSILRVPSLAAAPSDRTKDFSGRSNWRMPAVVNYRNDNNEPQSSWPGAIRSRGMPPYSPIRIRSGRGGAGRVASRRGGASFPVSNRGRRASTQGSRVPEEDEEEEPPLKMLQKLQGERPEETDTLRMLQKQDSPQKEPAEETTPAAKTEAAPESPPRSVLKRRLPMTRETAPEKEGDNNDEIKQSLSNASTESGTTSGSVAV